MAQVILPAHTTSFALVMGYSAADTQVTLYDEPVLAWDINDATGAEFPIIPGGFPLPPASPDPTKPT